jgi:excisionase family DNA binding protein
MPIMIARPAMPKRISPLADDDPMLTVKEIANDQHVSLSCAYRWIHEDGLTANRVGRTIRVRESVYRAWLKGKSAPQAPGTAVAVDPAATSSLAAESGALPLEHATPLMFWLMPQERH